MFTTENWTHSTYSCADKKAIISFGADETTNFIYFVSLLDTENKQVRQNEFQNLENAVQFINTEFGHWPYKDLEVNDEGGCGSCAAH